MVVTISSSASVASRSHSSWATTEAADPTNWVSVRSRTSARSSSVHWCRRASLGDGERDGSLTATDAVDPQPESLRQFIGGGVVRSHHHVGRGDHIGVVEVWGGDEGLPIGV